MQTLGDLLGSARRSATGLQGWLEASDPGFAEEARRAAKQSGASLASFARFAVADFSRFADEEAWARLTRVMRDSEDPGAACLSVMVRWQLARDNPGSLEQTDRGTDDGQGSAG